MALSKGTIFPQICRLFEKKKTTKKKQQQQQNKPQKSRKEDP